MRVKGLFAGAVALAWSCAAGAAETPAKFVATGDFDFYVLTLSWSPGFCDTGGDEKSPGQCAAGSGEGFVVHGLWPDNQGRADPSDCGRAERLSTEALAEVNGVYPDAGLARYEYAKHGTCTGLSPEAYFGAVKYARDQLVVPDYLKAPRERIKTTPSQIERDFIAANPNLTANNMAVTCGRGELIDVRVCLSKNLGAFVVCPKVTGHTCHATSITVAPPR
jgi:ribonuclease T2